MVGGTGPTPGPMTRADAEHWYDSLTNEPHGWAIEYDGQCVGVARLHGVDAAAAHAWLVVGLFAPEHRGRGLGTEAVRLLLGYAFATLGVDTVRVRVLAFNARAIACYRRCGFREFAREPVVLGSEVTDDILMETTAAEFDR